MPLSKSPSNEARQKNIKREIAAGRPTLQAVAIGYSQQERNKQRTSKARHVKKRAGK